MWKICIFFVTTWLPPTFTQLISFSHLAQVGICFLIFFSVLLSWSSSFPALVPSALQASFKLLLCHSSCLIAFNLIALPPFTRNHLGTLPGFLLRVSYMRWKRVDSNPRQGERLTGYSSGLCGRVIFYLALGLAKEKPIGAVVVCGCTETCHSWQALSFTCMSQALTHFLMHSAHHHNLTTFCTRYMKSWPSNVVNMV